MRDLFARVCCPFRRAALITVSAGVILSASSGRAVILDLHTPRNPTVRRLYRAYSFISPRLAAALGSDPEAYRYLPRSIEAFYDPEALAALLGEAGFKRVRFERLTFGVAAIHVGEA